VKSKKFNIIFTIICLIILIFSILFIEIPNINNKAKVVVFTMFFALLLWIVKPIPYSISGLLFLIIMYFFKVNTFSNIFSGFSSTGWFFFFGVLTLSHAVLKTDISERIALVVMKISKNVFIFAIFLPFLLIFQALILPSGTARAILLSPIFHNLLKKSGIKKDDSFSRFLMLNLGILNPIASSAYLSGGASTIIAGEVMSNHGIPMNWLLWLKYFWIPITLVVVFSSYQLYFFYNYHSLNISSLSIKIDSTEIAKKISFEEKCVILIIILVVLLWIVGSYLNISNAIPTLFAIILLYFPGINLLQIDDLKKINWDLLIFIGVSISLANLIISSGAGKWLAEYIFNYAQLLSNSRFTFFLTLFILLFLIRLIFPSATTFNACILPAVLSSAGHTNHDLLLIAIITILSGMVCFLPFQNIPNLLLFDKGYYRIMDTVITGFIIIISAFIAIIFTLIL